MTNTQNWAAYDVARHHLMLRIEALHETLTLELAIDPQDPLVIELLEAKIEELDLEHTLTRVEDFPPVPWP